MAIGPRFGAGIGGDLPEQEQDQITAESENKIMREYTLRELENLPTITAAHSADLKIENFESGADGIDGIRVWLDRCPAEEMPYVDTEVLRNGRWERAARYIPEFPTLPERLEDDGVMIKAATLEDIAPDYSGPGRDGYRWHVVIGQEGNGKTFQGHITLGSAYADATPELAVTFNCFMSSAGAYAQTGGNFAEHAEDFGMEFANGSERRKALKGFKVCGRILSDLRAMLGEEKVNEYLHRTEGY